MTDWNNKSELRVDFFLAGAAKCGSSSLAEYLAQHKQICFAYPKEPVFFADEDFESKYAFTWEEYKKCFKRKPEHRITGEGSILYIYSDSAIKNILEYNPDAKFIVMLRNPIDQAYSYFLQLRHSEYEREKDFVAAWERAPFPGRSLLNYHSVVSTGEQLQRLLAQVPREKVLLLTLEELIADSRALYLKVLDFLGVEDDGKNEFEVVNQAGTHRNFLMKFIFMTVTRNRFLYQLAVNTVRVLGISADSVNRLHKGKKTPKVKLAPELRQRMAGELKGQVAIISDILQRDMTEVWTDFKDPEVD